MKFFDYDVSANVSLLFGELPYLRRFEAAAAAGFRGVETWWPFDTPTPSRWQVAEVTDAIAHAGLRLTGLNFWAGDMAAGDRGVAGVEGRAAELSANIPVVLDIAERTGCRAFNLLIGKVDSSRRAVAWEQVVTSIAAAARAVDANGGRVLIEPLAASLNEGYPLRTAEDVVELLDGPLSDLPNVELLFDTFHLASNGVDVPSSAAVHASRIGHVQFADAPGRGEPGTGDIPFAETFAALRAAGYRGTVAAEYKPTRATEETLEWASQS